MTEPGSPEPTLLPVDRYLDGLYRAMVAFVRNAERAGLRAPVPTCPDWTVRDLVAHQGMVHRWAAATLRGEEVTDPEAEAFEREGRTDPDPLEWLRDGAVALAQALAEAPDDVRAVVFLKEAPAPRLFWARRQCHETTIHAVDALAAALGRLPTAAEVWFDDELALDGVDELLVGFLQRGKYQLNADPAGVLVVEATDRAAAWSLAIGPEGPVTTTRVAAGATGDWHLAGPAVDLYLGLWHRAALPAAAVLPDGWPSRTAVTWS